MFPKKLVWTPDLNFLSTELQSKLFINNFEVLFVS